MAKLYEYQTTADDEDEVFGNFRFGQAFTVGTVGDNVDNILTQIEVWGQKQGSPGIIVCELTETDGAGKPTGPILSSGTYNGNLLVNNWFMIEMSNYRLKPNMQYAFYFKVAGDATNRIFINYKRGSVYAGGTAVYSNDGGSSWYTPDDDLQFRQYGEPFNLIGKPIICPDIIKKPIIR